MCGILNLLLLVVRVTQPGPEGTIRVIAIDRFHGAAVRRAVEGALRRLEATECQTIFTDFKDATGARLWERLAEQGVSPPDYLRRLVFTDGSSHNACHESGTMAFTAPGSRVVYVCAHRFYQLQVRQPAAAQVIVLHEALHTLGLGEDPPSSDQITRRVESRCRHLPTRPLFRVARIPWGLPPFVPEE